MYSDFVLLIFILAEAGSLGVQNGIRIILTPGVLINLRLELIFNHSISFIIVTEAMLSLYLWDIIFSIILFSMK